MSARGVDLGRSRSLFVFERARSWSENDCKAVTARAQGLPVTLRSQGLVVTMARLAANEDKDTASRILKGMLLAWLTVENPYLGFKGRANTTREFLELLMTADRAAYLAVQREALALAERIKLISKAFFSGKEQDNG
ncbi:MAG: type III-B CRISPR module-associated protein Cmr5 [Syntrophaceae bacterium]